MPSKTVLSFAAVLLTASALQPERPDSKALDALIRAAVDARQVPAAVAMVATSRKVVYTGAAGVPADAIFDIASMTKPITSVAVMQLVEAGKVQLDQPAHTYLPELRTLQVLEGGKLRAPKSAPTVRQLLAHTSGFAYEFFSREISEYVQAGKLASGFTGTDQFLRAPLVADPGSRWEYGISTDWLGKIVEAVSGQPLDVYFRSRIFEPLGMADTFYEVPASKQSRLAPPHARQKDGTLGPLPPPPSKAATLVLGGGGLHSTAADYLAFAQALLAGGQASGRRLLKAETVTLMGNNQLGDAVFSAPVSQNPQFIVRNLVLPGAPDAFGLGFALNRKPLASGRGAGTMSWAGVFNTFFWIDRDRDVCAVLMAQLLPFGDAGPVKLMEDLDRILYKSYRVSRAGPPLPPQLPTRSPVLSLRAGSASRPIV